MIITRFATIEELYYHYKGSADTFKKYIQADSQVKWCNFSKAKTPVFFGFTKDYPEYYRFSCELLMLKLEVQAAGEGECTYHQYNPWNEDQTRSSYWEESYDECYFKDIKQILNVYATKCLANNLIEQLEKTFDNYCIEKTDKWNIYPLDTKQEDETKQIEDFLNNRLSFKIVEDYNYRRLLS